MVSDLNEISRGLDKFALLRLAPVIEAGNYLNRPPREGDVFDRSSLTRPALLPPLLPDRREELDDDGEPDRPRKPSLFLTTFAM